MNRRSLAGFGLAAAVVVGAALPAAADDPQPPVNPAFYNSNDQAIRGVGSDTTFAMMNDLGVAFQESPGCTHNTPTMPNDPTVIEGNCAATQPGGVITTENYDHEVHFGWFPTGSGNGIRQLCKQTLPKPANVPPVNYSRSSASAAATSSTNCRPGAGVVLRMKFVAYAKDGITWVNWAGGGGSGLTNLTKTQLQNIFINCSATNWNQVGGPNAPIIVYTAQNGSGTRSSWDFFLTGSSSTPPLSDACIPAFGKDGDLFTRTSTDSNGYVAGDTVIDDASAATKDANAFVVSPNFPAGTQVTAVTAGVSYTVSNAATGAGTQVTLNDPERKIFENNCQPVQAGLYEVDPNALNEGNAIFPYSFGAYANKGPAETCVPRSIDGIAPGETTIRNGTFPATRFVYNVFRDTDNGLGSQPAPIVAPFTLALVGETGWICKPGAGHSQPPDGIPGNGVESSNVTIDYGLLVWDTIRASGFFPLPDRTDATSNRCFTEIKDFTGA
ncbi:MAG: substrate-binding domain-containing protein [Nocardioidaceae bacterium]